MKRSIAEDFPTVKVEALARHLWENKDALLPDLLKELGPTSDFGPGADIAEAIRTGYGRATGHAPSPGFRHTSGGCGARALDIERYRAARQSDAKAASAFAIRVHATQFRRHTGEPYWLHLAQVAGLVEAFVDSHEAIAAAWLHDTLEDQPHAEEELFRTFPAPITDAVLLLSDLEKGTRRERKAAARERLAKAPGWVQTLKVCDLISNAPSIRTFEPAFWEECFRMEAEAMLAVLTYADPRPVKLLRDILDAT
jgi:guanosine-3',5'-bis(diphosphate) 3'-pyrophosphohydrolase